MLKASDIKYSYNSTRVFEFPEILCQSGESLLLLGPSGCGKSTWLHLMCGLLKSQNGLIQIQDTDITKLSASAMDLFRAKNIGVVLQKSHFISSLNVLDNLLLFQTLGGAIKNLDFICELLNQLGILGLINQNIQSLSQGELQRLNFARALIHKPKIILADEPTSALDDYHADLIANIMLEHAKSMNASLVIVTHDLRLKKLVNHQVQLS
ncbi:MAG: ATP-binding cassette domain-containing protein [Saprospiraceae bacterium]|nr:ATP-binding cassette domain-containing protein [Saprospiraceae bacterium]MBK8450565.1 ATP-binding cassette domain-containing protein [Saprospiraceae bacterium]MBK9222572.1 ATP-binding cassette domain-containing protein [Saprospiraceae bacterium]